MVSAPDAIKASNQACTVTEKGTSKWTKPHQLNISAFTAEKYEIWQTNSYPILFTFLWIWTWHPNASCYMFILSGSNLCNKGALGHIYGLQRKLFTMNWRPDKKKSPFIMPRHYEFI